MLKRLFTVALLFKEYVLFAFFAIVSLGLLALNDTAQMRAVRSLTVLSVGAMQDALSFIPNYFDLRRENRALRELNLTLTDEVSRLREARLENIRLRQMLGLKDKTRYGYAAANVVGKTLQLLRNTITLDVGEKDGIRTNMPWLRVGDGFSREGGFLPQCRPTPCEVVLLAAPIDVIQQAFLLAGVRSVVKPAQIIDEHPQFMLAYSQFHWQGPVWPIR